MILLSSLPVLFRIFLTIGMLRNDTNCEFESFQNLERDDSEYWCNTQRE